MARHASPGGVINRHLPSNAVAQRTGKLRLTELGLMVLAWLIISSFYVLASLGSQNKMPARFGWFLGGVVVISLLMHFAIQRFAPHASEVLLPIATLLNGLATSRSLGGILPTRTPRRSGTS